jgi:hypothetical protein
MASLHLKNAARPSRYEEIFGKRATTFAFDIRLTNSRPRVSECQIRSTRVNPKKPVIDQKAKARRKSKISSRLVRFQAKHALGLAAFAKASAAE